MSAFGGPNIVDNGLVLYLDAGNRKSYTSGSTTWFDKSGFNNNGTLTNGPTFNTGSGGSIVFDGTNDYVNLGNILTTNTNPFSIEFTAQVSIMNNSYSKVISKGLYQTSGFVILLGRTPGGVYFVNMEWKQVNNAWVDFGVNTPINTNTWYHITYVYNSTTSTMHEYINGIQTALYNSATPNLVSSYNYVIGAAGGGTDEFFKGNVGFVKQYNRALSASEVLQNYNATKGRFGL